MTKIETTTKYRCDGCSKEQVTPFGWRSVTYLNPQGHFLTTAGLVSEDYCDGCYSIMRAAIKNPEVSRTTGFET